MKYINLFFLRLTCFLFGHGEFKTYWKTLGPGVQAETFQCEFCGVEK
jgi:hypothetical protein